MGVAVHPIKNETLLEYDDYSFEDVYFQTSLSILTRTLSQQVTANYTTKIIYSLD